MAILLPHQGPVPSNASGEMKKGESFSVSLPEDNGIYAASHEMNDGLINIDNVRPTKSVNPCEKC
eukprot:560657-Amorphochlora_amoeboformis.AAC.1